MSISTRAVSAVAAAPPTLNFPCRPLDVYAFMGDHIGTEISIGTAIASFRVSDRMSGIVHIARSRLTRLVRPESDLVLTVPMIVHVGPHHQGHVPALAGRQRRSEVRNRMQAVRH